MLAPSTQILSAVRLIILTICLCSSFHVFADDNIDEFNQSFNSVDDVNEGQLVFLASPPVKPVLHSKNMFTLTQNSIDSGWVKLEQCYSHLDKVPDMEIVYRYKQMTGLELISSQNIADIQMTDRSAILKQVGDQAEICIRAQVRNFYQNPDKTFSLVNGPYHRRFLDGYYPYHLSLTVNFNGLDLRLIRTIPARQTGFEAMISHQSLSIDTLFEGKLNSELVFEQLSTPPAISD